jgi:S1-C subfamily serine protease
MCSTTAARLLLSIFSAVFFSSVAPAQDSQLLGLESGLTDLVFRASRSVVTVEASHRLPTSRFGSAADESYAKELATGIVVDTGGLILVAARPVLDKDRIGVRFEGRLVPAELVAIDFQTELALLRARGINGEPAVIAQTHSCAGQMVLAVGQAHGFRSSPSLGFCAGIRDDGVVQFSMPNLGSGLGTGVFDLSGRLLGIVSGIIGPEPAMATAVPAHKIPGIVAHLLKRGDRRCGFIGITSQEIEISPGLVVPYGGVVPAASRSTRQEIIERGVLIGSVLDSSPAERAGLHVGDLIYAVNSMPINSAAGLASLVKQCQPGTKMSLDLIRREQSLTVPLVVGTKTLTVMAASSPNRLADSLRGALKQLSGKIRQIESRLNGLD